MHSLLFTIILRRILLHYACRFLFTRNRTRMQYNHMVNICYKDLKKNFVNATTGTYFPNVFLITSTAFLFLYLAIDPFMTLGKENWLAPVYNFVRYYSRDVAWFETNFYCPKRFFKLIVLENASYLFTNSAQSFL